MTALGTLAEFHPRSGSVQRITSNTLEDGLATFAFEALMVPAIIVEPQAEKYRAALYRLG